MDTLIYSFTIFIVGVIVLAFYTTVQSFSIHRKELEFPKLELKVQRNIQSNHST